MKRATAVEALRALCGVCALVLCSVGSAGAQLRPLHPMSWEVFTSPSGAAARLGGGIFSDQRASLAGTQGQLVELGDFLLAMRSGRMAVELAGTALRLFEDRMTFAAPSGGALASSGESRRDAGDYRVSTLVLLTGPGRPTSTVLRFGVRLPTTDNEVGLERDRTDFFALLGGRTESGGLRIAAEAGVGINGTHDLDLEQSDVLMYSATIGYSAGMVTPRMSLVGHMDGMSGRAIRGNEELSELRVGARVGRKLWLEAEVVRGLQPFSPSAGLLFHAGAAY